MKLKELLLLMQNAAKEANSSKPLLCGGIARDRYMGRLENISDLDVTEIRQFLPFQKSLRRY